MILIKTPKQEVALKFFPSSISAVSAKQQLRREIKETIGLKEKLAVYGSVCGHGYN